MKDRYGRKINYLRMSVTERCSLRCVYCREAEETCCGAAELSTAEICRIVSAMTKQGVTKIRFTGGEPLVRQDLDEMVWHAAKKCGIEDISVTTNGQALCERLEALLEAGLRRVNVSLDSLDAGCYARMTRGGQLKNALQAIEALLARGMHPVKINVVLVRGLNDTEAADFISLAREYPVDVRFIELMPMGTLGKTPDLRVTGDEILARFPALAKLPPRNIHQPSADYAAEGFRGRVGFINPVSHGFCMSCNRIRVTSDGRLRMCLGNNEETDLRPLLREDDALLGQAVAQAVWHKPQAHMFGQEFCSARTMNRIGG